MGSDQLGFAGAFLDPRLGTNERLARIEALIAWHAIERHVAGLRPGETGRPPYRALSMLKALYLQAMYDLSDPGLEEALLDRLSFRRFCGFALDAGTPDATTLLRFRHVAAEAGVLETCFGEINRQLAARGLMLKKGTLLDATLVAATHNPPPIEAGAGASHSSERAASWTKKNGRSHFGYKAHIGMDAGSGLVRQAILTGAKVYESEVADRLICWDERAVYGDKAYPKKARRAALKAAGIKDRIARRRHKSEGPLSPRAKRRNALIARRAPVEGIFSQLKRFYGFERTRCHTLARNAADLFATLNHHEPQACPDPDRSGQSRMSEEARNAKNRARERTSQRDPASRERSKTTKNPQPPQNIPFAAKSEGGKEGTRGHRGPSTRPLSGLK